MKYSWQKGEGVVYLVQLAEHESIALRVETNTPPEAVPAVFVVGRGGEVVSGQSPPFMISDDSAAEGVRNHVPSLRKIGCRHRVLWEMHQFHRLTASAHRAVDFMLPCSLM